MAYSAQINRNDPTCLLFLLDQSGSMEEEMPGGKSKAAFVADCLNRTLMEVVGRCSKPEGVRDYFDIGIIGYGADSVRSGFPAGNVGDWLYPVSSWADHPIRVDTSTEKAAGAGGEIYERKSICPVWVEPVARGSTPMKAAMERACRLLSDWCDAHPASYPPTVLHISDGRPTDGDPEPAADILRQMHTDDGPCVLANLHIDTGTGAEVTFPAAEAGLPDDHARLLFRMSSPFPAHLLPRARQHGMGPEEASRFFLYKASADFIVHFLDIGTRPAAVP